MSCYIVNQQLFIQTCILIFCNYIAALETTTETHITLSDESKQNIMEHFAEFSSNNIVKQISAGKDGKINGDIWTSMLQQMTLE